MEVYPLHIYFNKYFCNDTLLFLHLEFLLLKKKQSVLCLHLAPCLLGTPGKNKCSLMQEIYNKASLYEVTKVPSEGIT